MIQMITGAGLVLAGILFGQIRFPRRRGPKPAKPWCGCEHDLAHHEPDGDGGGMVCHKLVKGAANKWDEDGFKIGWEMVQCSCKQYTGPRILDPGYVARELTEGNGR